MKTWLSGEEKTHFVRRLWLIARLIVTCTIRSFQNGRNTSLWGPIRWLKASYNAKTSRFHRRTHQGISLECFGSISSPILGSPLIVVSPYLGNAAILFAAEITQRWETYKNHSKQKRDSLLASPFLGECRYTALGENQREGGKQGGLASKRGKPYGRFMLPKTKR